MTDARVAAPGLFHAVVIAAGFALAFFQGRPTPLLVAGVVMFAAYVWRARAVWTPQGSFGLANWITAARLALAVATALVPAVPYAGLLILVFFTLDGVDGWAAKRFKTQSAFGSAFDMETDAFMVAIASLVTVEAGLLGPWILLVGGLRYAFVILTHVHTSEPEPRRRLARWAFSALMCGLIGALVLPHPFTVGVLAFGAIAVILSFARSFVWAWSHSTR